MAPKDKFHKSKQNSPEELEKKGAGTAGVSFQDGAMKTKLSLTERVLTKAEVQDELVTRYIKAQTIEEHINLSPKRKARILEKVLLGPTMEDRLLPLRPGDQGEAACYMAWRDVQDVVTILTEILYGEMQAAKDAQEVGEGGNAL